MLKKLFGGGRKQVQEKDYTVEDLIVLERYDEAASRLQSRLKLYPNDLHARLKLADVYIHLRQLSKAVDEYVYVAEEYASDGFFDKGIALLAKVRKFMPADETLPEKIGKIQQSKRQELIREQALEGLREGMGESDQAGSTALELQALWGKLLRSNLVRRLPGDQLKQLFKYMRLEHLPVNRVVAQKDSLAGELFLIVQGTIEAEAVIRGTPTQLRIFSSGDIIGDGAMLERKAWPALYRVVESASVLKLTREGLEQVLVGNPDPRGLLGVLREQQNDQKVSESLRRLLS